MKKSTIIKVLLALFLAGVCFAASAQTEVSEIRFGFDINSHQTHTTVGFKKTFFQDGIHMVGSVYESFAIGSAVYKVQFGVGYELRPDFTLVLYPFWFKQNRNYTTGYTTPVSIVAEWCWPRSQAILLEAGFTYENRDLYSTVRFSYRLLNLKGI